MKERKTKMTAIELEKKIEEMRLQYVKTHWDGDINNFNKQDLLCIYNLMLTKEEMSEGKQNEEF
jgi:hypothetical protein